MQDKQFRFQDLEIWNRAAEVSARLLAIADRLEEGHKYRFAEQLRGAVLSITNNIAEGAGSMSSVEFRNYLNMARRSVFEVANILVLLDRYGYLKNADTDNLLDELQQESRMILAFMKRLKGK